VKLKKEFVFLFDPNSCLVYNASIVRLIIGLHLQRHAVVLYVVNDP